MKDANGERPDFEDRWRKWSRAEPSIDEHQLRRNLLDRIPDPRLRVRPRVVFAAAAASLLAVLIGFEATRQPSSPVAVEEPAAVYETGDNVILVLREGGEPIYVVTGSAENAGGDR